MIDIAIRDISRSDYSRFLAESSHSAFHRLGWLDAVSEVYGVQIRLLGYFRHGALVAVTPLMGRRVGLLKIWGAPLRKCATPPATPFCAPEDSAPIMLPLLRRWIVRQRLGFVQVTIPGDLAPDSDLAERVEPLDNLELDLQQPLEAIWRNLAQQKSAVRKAVRSGVHLHWRYGPNVLDVQRALTSATYDKQGLRPNIPERMYAELLSHQTDTGVRVLCAMHAGRTVAAIWVFCDSRKCYYWDAASLAESRNLNANHLLVWCLIRWAHRKGYQTLDFVGTSAGGRDGSRPGIGHFKQSMGGRPVHYQLVYRYSWLMYLAFSTYRTINRLRMRLRIAR